jgi:hypothetical protein
MVLGGVVLGGVVCVVRVVCVRDTCIHHERAPWLRAGRDRADERLMVSTSGRLRQAPLAPLPLVMAAVNHPPAGGCSGGDDPAGSPSVTDRRGSRGGSR